MSTKINWHRTDDSRNDPDNRGFWTSAEGRFDISPNYRSTVNADSFTVNDRMAKQELYGQTLYNHRTADTVKECKEWAQQIVDREWKKRNA